LAGDYLKECLAPTLLIVGGLDYQVGLTHKTEEFVVCSSAACSIPGVLNFMFPFFPAKPKVIDMNKWALAQLPNGSLEIVPGGVCASLLLTAAHDLLL